MKVINIHVAKTHLSRILERVAAGERIVLGRAGKPIAVLSPYVDPAGRRQPGALKGRIRIGNDFDGADDSIADLFEGRSDG